MRDESAKIVMEGEGMVMRDLVLHVLINASIHAKSALACLSRRMSFEVACLSVERSLATKSLAGLITWPKWFIFPSNESSLVHEMLGLVIRHLMYFVNTDSLCVGIEIDLSG